MLYQVCTHMKQDQHWVDTPSRFLDGVLRLEQTIGWLQTPGIQTGVIMVGWVTDLSCYCLSRLDYYQANIAVHF